MLEESDNRTPLVCLLSTGSDPSPQIEAIAKLRCQEMRQLSMGQGENNLLGLLRLFKINLTFLRLYFYVTHL
jgi:hypothetical protein